MTSDVPPDQRYRIEIVPLGNAPVTPGPIVPSGALAPRARAYPRLVLEQVPVWSAPAVRTTHHRAAAFTFPPQQPTDSTTTLLAHRPGISFSLTERLTLAIARERAALDSETAEPIAIAMHDSMAAPFPLPTTTLHATTARRVPKAVRPGGAARPLTPDIAAAMARATGHTETSPVSESTLVRSTARDRLIIVPLGDPPSVGLVGVPTLHPDTETIDLRDPQPSEADESVDEACTKCGTMGVVDVIDHITGEVKLSCPACSRMWQQPIGTHAEK